MIIVILGVAGCGKTTVGLLLAENIDGVFVDADSLHPPRNVERMATGVPLCDEDRWPWLERVRMRMDEAREAGETLVVACSALRKRYRDFLREGSPDQVAFVYLKGAPEQIAERLAKRTGHFMPGALLRSQFEALDEPAADEAVTIDIAGTPKEIVNEIVRRLAG